MANANSKAATSTTTKARGAKVISGEFNPITSMNDPRAAKIIANINDYLKSEAVPGAKRPRPNGVRLSEAAAQQMNRDLEEMAYIFQGMRRLSFELDGAEEESLQSAAATAIKWLGSAGSLLADMVNRQLGRGGVGGFEAEFARLAGCKATGGEGAAG